MYTTENQCLSLQYTHSVLDYNVRHFKMRNFHVIKVQIDTISKII